VTERVIRGLAGRQVTAGYRRVYDCRLRVDCLKNELGCGSITNVEQGTCLLVILIL